MTALELAGELVSLVHKHGSDLLVTREDEQEIVQVFQHEDTVILSEKKN